MGGQTDADIAIVGSGIIGTTAAIALHDAGFRVLVIEPNEPGAGTASGSAGYLHDGEIFPVAQPSLFADLPRMLLDPTGPLVVRASYLPRLAPWGVRLLATMRPHATERSIDGAARLNRLSVDALFSVAAASDAQEFLVRRGGLKIVADSRTLDKLSELLPVLHSHGIAAQPLDAAQVHAYEPALAPQVAGAIFFPDSAHCTDPARFGERLAKRVRGQSTMVSGRVRKLSQSADGGWLLDIAREKTLTQISVPRVLVAAGYASGELLRPLGYRVPVAAARGYHLMIAQPNVSLARPMIFYEPHIGATPMNGGVRLAGTIEFAAPEASPDFRRSSMLYGIAKRYIPDLADTDATSWVGTRPLMPDSLPAIGRGFRHKNLYYSFGHGHLGFTQAAVSARAIGELIGGTPSTIDVNAYDLKRFHGGYVSR